MITAVDTTDILQMLQKHDVSVAYLFGSQANNTSGPLSDIDIAVMFPHSVDNSAQYAHCSDIANDLERKYGRSVDVINLNMLRNPLLAHNAVFQSTILLGEDSIERFALETRIRQEYEDTRHLRNTQNRLQRERFHTGTFGHLHTTSPYLEKIKQSNVTNQ